MKTLDRYILRQLISVTLIGVISLTSLLLLGQIFKELQTLLVDSGAPPTIVLEFIMQVIPFSLTFSVPWGFLTAVLLVYGRLAADNELTSMRMAGLTLWRLSAPAIGLGLALAGLCYYINIEVAPKGKQAMSDLILRAAMDNPKNLLGRSQNAVKIDKVNLYIESRQGDVLHGLHVYPILDEDGVSILDFKALHAEQATVSDFDPYTRMLNFQLTNATIEHEDDSQTTSMPLIESMPIQVNIPASTKRRIKANRFTNGEITEIMAQFDLTKQIEGEEMRQEKEHQKSKPSFPAADILWNTAYAEYNHICKGMTVKYERSFLTEKSKRASFSCACIVFALIGVPLAITARRRDTSTGFALGILVAAFYFLALVFCEISRKSAGIAPHIILWLPNVVGIIYAIFLHHRAKYRG
ncbi:MAG: LptF/LptG family permease [Akkermansia sp.]